MPEAAVLSRPKPAPAVRPDRRPRIAAHYWAFLSYSHADSDVADWLHTAIEQFRVPPALVGRLTAMGPVPRRLTPIFRDRHELAAAGDLSEEIDQALAGSRFLIVLCSPAATRSRWINKEIECFKRQHGEGCVLAAIVDGEPFASEIEGREAEECFPEALRVRYDRRGRVTDRRAEPMAADLREGADGRDLGLLKIVAGMLGLGLDDLVQRETHRRQRRNAILSGASLLGMLVSFGLAFTAIQARDAARDQRREAEGLIGFMLGDLREKLEPIGKLDVLDSVGAKVLQYYARQDKADLSDQALAQRAKALTGRGALAFTRGDRDGGMERYNEAMATTAEAARRTPDNAQALFDHAQNIFWVGYVEWQRGQTEQAAGRFRAYRQLADRMIALAPGDPKYRLERIYADTNLGAVLLAQRRFGAAANAYQASLEATEALLATDPANLDYQKQLSEMLAYLAEAREDLGEFDDAIALRRRQLDLLARSSPASSGDMLIKRKEFAARRSMSRMLASRGDVSRALTEARNASQILALLMKREPNNTEWLNYGVKAGFERGELELSSGRRDEAVATTNETCAVADNLLRRDRSVVDWRTTFQRLCLTLRARLALDGPAPSEALPYAQQALTIARTEPDPVDRGFVIAASQLLLSKALQASGQPDAARGAVQAALAIWPKGVEEKPRELADHALLLSRLGQDSTPYSNRLSAMGYRYPAYQR